jgi:hypothetical protein
MFEHLKYLRRNAVHARALDLLTDPSSYPAMKPLPSRDIRLQLYTLPSFEPFATWTIYSSDQGKYIVRRIRWDRAADGFLEIGSPTTFGADTWIELELVDGYLSKLSEMMIPAFRTTSGFGLDGVTYGIRRQTLGHFAEISWWSRPAPGQEVLSEWYGRLIDDLETRLPAATEPVPKEEVPR